jgi:DNA-binding winged helix-turn-helix (wHTH) protein
LLAFGPYVLDTTRRSLTRDGEEVVLGERHLARLSVFTSRPGEVIPKDVLIDQAWRGVAVPAAAFDLWRRSHPFCIVNPTRRSMP